MILLEAIVLAIVAILLFLSRGYKPPPEKPSALFRMYLSTSLVLGMAIIAMEVNPWPIKIEFGFAVVICWVAISSMAIFEAPLKWSVLPLGYISALAAYAVFRDAGPIGTIAFGAIVALGSITGLVLIKSGMSRKTAVNLPGENLPLPVASTTGNTISNTTIKTKKKRKIAKL